MSANSWHDPFTAAERAVFRQLKTPEKIQHFLDCGLAYNKEPDGPSLPLAAPRAARPDGALHGGGAVRRGRPAHDRPSRRCCWIWRRCATTITCSPSSSTRGHWGAVAKSNYSGLRYREPVYRTLRELVMTYFEHYYNLEEGEDAAALLAAGEPGALRRDGMDDVGGRRLGDPRAFMRHRAFAAAAGKRDPHAGPGGRSPVCGWIAREGLARLTLSLMRTRFWKIYELTLGVVRRCCRGYCCRPAVPAGALAKVDQIVGDVMRRQQIPAMTVAIGMGDRIVYSKGSGTADLENAVPATTDSLIRTGSISKPISAAAAMTLVEAGKLDLDAPVQKYCAPFPVKPFPITTRELLSHTAGIRHYKGDEISSTRHYKGMSDGFAIFANDPLLFEPGSAYSYSTYGYTVVGCAIEGASGEKFADYVAEHVLKPAGMTHTFVDDVFEIVPHRARGYQKVDGKVKNAGLHG